VIFLLIYNCDKDTGLENREYGCMDLSRCDIFVNLIQCDNDTGLENREYDRMDPSR
jgi:hypothetical protein